MFIRKFLCEAVSFASWRDLNQLYSLPHKAVDCVSFCAALNVLFASVRRRYNLGPTPYSSLPQCGHVLLLTLFFFRCEGGVPSGFQLFLHLPLAHIWGHDQSVVMSYSDLQKDRKFSTYIEEKIHPKCCSHELLLKDMTKSKWMQKNRRSSCREKSV